jgi:hypothetical protein
LTEAELTGEILSLAGELGVLAHHCPDSRRCHGPKGFPDLVLAGTRGTVFAELKNDYSDTTADQEWWRWHLVKSGQHWRLWRPADLANGTIRSTLERIA